MNCFASILAEWENNFGCPQPRDRIVEHRPATEVEHRATIKNLRQKLCGLEIQLTAAATAIVELHVENEILQGQDATRNIRPIRQDVSGAARRR